MFLILLGICLTSCSTSRAIKDPLAVFRTGDSHGFSIIRSRSYSDGGTLAFFVKDESGQGFWYGINGLMGGPHEWMTFYGSTASDENYVPRSEISHVLRWSRHLEEATEARQIGEDLPPAAKIDYLTLVRFNTRLEGAIRGGRAAIKNK